MANKSVKIAAVMTAARYENTYCRNYIEIALKYLGIPLTVSGGVYYGQCMQKMFTDLCARDCEYVVTVDGDSLFTSDHLQRLLSIIAQEVLMMIFFIMMVVFFVMMIVFIAVFFIIITITVVISILVIIVIVIMVVVIMMIFFIIAVGSVAGEE